jgi:hypothetical protein
VHWTYVGGIRPARLEGGLCLFREKSHSIIRFIPKPLHPVLRRFKFLRELKKRLTG